MTTVLLADDDPDILDSTRDLLELAGYTVVTTANAAEIVAKIEASKADILLQDVNMPGLSIGALVRAVRALPRRVPVILFTAAADAEETRRATGADDLVRKPFDAGALGRAIARSVG